MSKRVNLERLPAVWAVAEEDMLMLNFLLKGMKTSSKVFLCSLESMAPKPQIVARRTLDQKMSFSHSLSIASYSSSSSSLFCFNVSLIL